MYIVHPNPSHIFCITIGKALDCCWLWPTESFFKWNSLAWVCVVSQYNWVLCNSSEKNVYALPEKTVRANGVLFHIMTRRYSIYIYASATMEFRKGSFTAIEGFLSIFVCHQKAMLNSIVQVSKTWLERDVLTHCISPNGQTRNVTIT